MDASTKEKIWKGSMKKEAPSNDKNHNDVRNDNEGEYKTRCGEEKECCK